MEDFQTIYTILFAVVVVFFQTVLADGAYMVTNPETITIPLNYETKLTCEMSIDTDKFLWKFYRSNDPFNPDASISLDSNYSTFDDPSAEKYSKPRKKSSLTLKKVEERHAGDYQCLAFYGAYVVASVPWRITLATMRDFPDQKNIDMTVIAGNTISWWCDPPYSNPDAYIDYYKEGNGESLYASTRNKLLVLTNVSTDDSGVYKCKATNTALSSVQKVLFSKAMLNLRVVRQAPRQPPYFITQPKSSYTIVGGNMAFLGCSAVGNPVPQVVWLKRNGPIPSDRSEMTPGGLIIRNVTESDDGVYVCNYKNSLGTISHHITLNYNEAPSVECIMNNTDVKEKDNLELDCTVKGTPKPQIIWFLNGFTVAGDSNVQTDENKITFKPVEKRHAGNLQCFARNIVGTTYSSVSIRVIPLSSSVDEGPSSPAFTYHRQNGKTMGTTKPSKHSKLPKMVPPTRPIISRLNDETVVVRWSVPSNNGLPIQFFKVQYKELGPSGGPEHHKNGGKNWKTTNADIAPNIRNYDVTNLKPDYVYRFRIAAVYSNSDNKAGPISNKFHLRRLDFDQRNPLPIPVITRTEPVNDTSIKIYWKYTPVSNITIDGFYISYISASTAGDYMKATADGEDTMSYVITHLTPDTLYDVKLQSFTSKFASEFSAIMKVKTAASPVTLSSSTTPPSVPTPSSETGDVSQLYIIIVGALVLVAFVIGLVVILFVCRKWHKSKNLENRDKMSVEDHRNQTDANEYMNSGQKPQQRSNGCAPRITITANPLADADNKNQNMMEMSCLTSQNNNCSTQPSASSGGGGGVEESPGNSKEKTRHKNREKNKRNNKHSVDTATSREYYV